MKKILLKITSRSRPDKLLSLLDNISEHVADDTYTKIVLSLDINDPSLNNDEFKKKLLGYKIMKVFWGLSKNKIDAFNRDISKVDWKWDIIVAVSDDTLFCYKGFDNIIRYYAEGFQGVMCFFESYLRNELPVMPIMTRTYFKRFNYIYCPEYENLFADDELREVAKSLGQYKVIKSPFIFSHNHPANDKQYKLDDQYKEQGSKAASIKDQKTYKHRSRINFEL